LVRLVKSVSKVRPSPVALEERAAIRWRLRGEEV
jgi:hypothetical protein